MSEELNAEQREHMDDINDRPRKEICPCGWNSEAECLRHCSTGTRTHAPSLVRRIKEIYAQIDKQNTRQAPKVKALEWVAVSTPEWDNAGIAVRTAKTFFGEYRIRSIPRNSEHIWDGPLGTSESYADYVDAKSAAQADYERRILSALEE